MMTKNDDKKMTIKAFSFGDFFKKYTQWNPAQSNNGSFQMPNSFLVPVDLFPVDIETIEFIGDDTYIDEINSIGKRNWNYSVEEFDDINKLCTLTKKTIFASEVSIDVEIVKA